MILAVILAAGEATRMGEAKQLLDWQGEPLVLNVLRKAQASPFAGVRLVLGAYAEEILVQTEEAMAEIGELEVLINPDYQKGQSTSVKLGLAGLTDEFQGVAFLLADQPLVQIETLDTLIGSFLKYQPGILVPTYQGQPGNPKFFHQRFFTVLSEVEGDHGGRELIGQNLEEVLWVEVDDPGILLDIDHREEYLRLIAEYNNFPEK